MSKKSVNKVTLIGHLGANPELRVSANEGVPVTTVRVATTERWNDRHSGERKEQTEWHRVVCFGALAKFVGDYLAKGSLVYLEGRLNTRRYADREGTEHSVTEVIARELRMLDSRKDGETVPPESQSESPQGSPVDPDWDDDTAF